MLKKLILRLVLTCCVLTALVVGGIIVTYLLATAVPEHYALAVEIQDSGKHKQRFEATLVRFVASELTPDQRLRLRNEPTIQTRFGDGEWSAIMEELNSDPTPSSQTIRQEELNAWIADEIPLARGDGLRDPRVLFRSGRIMLASRIEISGFSLVLTADLTPQVTPDQFILEITGLSVGHVPLPVDRLADLLAAYQPNVRKGISLDLKASPPRICFDWESDQDLRIRLRDATVQDGEIEITVTATESLE